MTIQGKGKTVDDKAFSYYNDDERIHIQKESGQYEAKNSAVVALYILSCCLWGGYHEFVSGLLATALTSWLLFHRSDALRFSRSIGFLTPCVVALCYLLVTLWAQDRGMAPMGVVKFLPLPLFALCLL